MHGSTHGSFGDSFGARMMPKLKVFLGALAITLPLDQLTKFAVIQSLTFADRVAVIDGFFYLTHVRNPGSAFGLFAESPEPYRSIFFIGITGVAMIMILSFYRRLAPGDRLPALALGLILGGAAGNLIDRIRVGEVVDFLHFRLWGGYAWPDFNLADSFIVVGVGLLILELLATEGERRADPAGTGSQE
jgi:signal peptidase II